MRTVITAVLLVSQFGISNAVEKKDTIAAAKVSAERLKKEWSLTAISATSGHDSGKSTEVTILVRFEKDVADDVRNNVKASCGGQDGGRVPTDAKRGDVVWVNFLDKDNVVVHKHHIRVLKGEVTGKAGDAFRVITDCDDEVISNVKRIELRHSSEATKK